MKHSKYWTMFGGVVAFAVFGFLLDFIPFYTQNHEIELLGIWSLMALGALLGVAISLGTKRRTPEGLFLIGTIAFWFAYQVVTFAIDYDHDYTHTIDFLSPWFEIGAMAAISAIGCMILGGRLNGWHGMLFLFVVGALSVGLGEFLRTLDKISPDSTWQTFYAQWKSGRAFLLVRAVSGALIWCLAWYFYPQARLERSDE
ncbi:MAG: hypothetical protein NT075_25060 [Chloroflexi bacterium]|nr:hypothetical protein [Chloroflexota bacterium]